MITMRNWMFISTFAQLRDHLFNTYRLMTLEIWIGALFEK